MPKSEACKTRHADDEPPDAAVTVKCQCVFDQRSERTAGDDAKYPDEFCALRHKAALAITADYTTTLLIEHACCKAGFRDEAEARDRGQDGP